MKVLTEALGAQHEITRFIRRVATAKARVKGKQHLLKMINLIKEETHPNAKSDIQVKRSDLLQQYPLLTSISNLWMLGEVCKDWFHYIKLCDKERKETHEQPVAAVHDDQRVDHGDRGWEVEGGEEGSTELPGAEDGADERELGRGSWRT
jgi:hypothetical protein